MRFTGSPPLSHKPVCDPEMGIKYPSTGRGLTLVSAIIVAASKRLYNGLTHLGSLNTNHSSGSCVRFTSAKPRGGPAIPRHTSEPMILIGADPEGRSRELYPALTQKTTPKLVVMAA